MSCRLAAGVVLVVGVFAAGCNSGPTPVQVTGDVALNGTKVGVTGLDATIRFEPADPSAGRPADGPIVDGRYTVTLMPGNYSVSVTWVKHKKGDQYMRPDSTAEVNSYDLIELIPEKYNRKTVLQAEVSQQKAVHDFNLASDPKVR